MEQRIMAVIKYAANLVSPPFFEIWPQSGRIESFFSHAGRENLASCLKSFAEKLSNLTFPALKL